MLSCNEELAEARVKQEQTHRRRIKLRVGMAVAAAALVGTVYQITHWNSDNATTDEVSKNANQQQKTVAKFANPCAPVTATTTPPPCAAFNGSLFAPAQACCATACGSFCGASNCQSAPIGYQSCCTGNFSNLCGSAGVEAPCLLPKTIAGAIQLLVDNLSAFSSNPAALAAVKNALSKLLGVPVADITASLAAAAGGRRLAQEAVNVDYVLRLPTASNLTATAVVAQAPNFAPALNSALSASSVPVTVVEAELPTPVAQEPGAAAVATPAPAQLLSTTTAAGTVEFMGLITISTNASKLVLESAESRTALADALAQVFGISAKSITVLGESDGSGDTVNAGYDITLPESITAQMVQSSGPALVAALQSNFNKSGVAATVKSVTFGTPQEVTTTKEVTTTTLGYNMTL
jgi:hypothetical protein